MVHFAVIDLETTGVRPKGDRILEVSILALSPDGEVREQVNTLLNPQRPVDATDVHGIESADVAHAPSFADVAGDVFSALHDAIIVGHNVRFDLSFIAAEAAACGWILPPAPFLCTLELGTKLGFAERGRRLIDLCAATGIDHARAHHASSDARAVAALFTLLVDRMPSAARGLIMRRAGAGADLWPAIPVSGRGLRRDEAKQRRAQSPSYIASLLSKLPADGSAASAKPNLISYLALLDRVLEDRYVSSDEADALHEMAVDLGLGLGEVQQAHDSYLGSLLIAALKDGVITANERADLLAVARLLGFDETTLEARIRAAEGGIAAFVERA